MVDLLQKCINCGHPLEEHDWGKKSINNDCLVEDCSCQGFAENIFQCLLMKSHEN